MPATTALRVLLFLATSPRATTHVVRLAKKGRNWWSGKRIAVIGPSASGKDSFLSRLQNREIPPEHARSAMRQKVKSFRVNLALSHEHFVRFMCKGVINVGGTKDYRDAPEGWMGVCKNADVVFYVMTVEDLTKKRFYKGRRVREDLDWLQSALPHFKRNALIHVLINKIDERIDSHVNYPALIKELTADLRAFGRTVEQVLHPYEARYTGATLISMKNKQIYTLAVNGALRAVYAAIRSEAHGETAPVVGDVVSAEA